MRFPEGIDVGLTLARCDRDLDRDDGRYIRL